MDSLTLFGWAKELGFADAGICSISEYALQRQTVMEQPQLKERKQLRFDPREDYPQAKSIAALLWPYEGGGETREREVFVDHYYEASNAAYHAAIALEKRMLDRGHFAKANVSYPAKETAVRCGLGVIGKNSLLIHPQYGSRVIIILMLTDLVCEERAQERNGCVNCGCCVAACPVGAIDAHGEMHPEKCLRNYMMEGVVVPETLRTKMKNTLIGCDRCQRVCPMQKSAHAEEHEAFLLEDFVTLDEAKYAGSVKRLAERIGRNAARPQRVRAQAALLCGNIGSDADLPVLKVWAESEFEAVREHAQWAIKQITERKESTQGLTRSGLDQRP